MQNNYHQPQKSPTAAWLIIAAFSMLAVAAVETVRSTSRDPHVGDKQAAATLAGAGIQALKAERLRRGLPIDPSTDPAESGLIGTLMTPVTSNNGHLPAKQTSVNPNFAAVVVQMLKDAGVREGDVVAVGFSGSFPALNLATCAAMESLKLKPIVISSASASQWGANHPEFLWIDMEKTLHDRGLIGFRSVAVSLGGIEDRGVGLSEEGIEMLKQAAVRNELPLLEPAGFADSIQQRMNLYARHADGAPVKAYINVGGGSTSVGTYKVKKRFDPGLNLRLPHGALAVDSVMGRFSRRGTPVVHLVRVADLATRYGLPVQPAELPTVGEGGVYSPQHYNHWLAAGLLVTILVSLYVTMSRRGAERAVPLLSFSRSPSEEEPLAVA